MRWKTTVVLLIVTVGLGVYVSQYELKQPTREARERQAKVLLRLKPADVTQIAVAMPQGQFTLVRQDKTWRLQPGDYRADTDVVEGLLAAAQPLEAERMLTPAAERPLDVKAYGLEPALGTITLTTGSTTQMLLLGEPTAIGGSRYAKMADQPSVAIVSAEVWEQTNKPPEAFRDRRLVRLETWDVQTAALESAAARFHLARQAESWRLTAPLEDQADSAEVTEWLNKVAFLRIQKFLAAEAAAPAGTPQATVTLQRKGEDTTPLVITLGPALPEDAKLLWTQRSDEPHHYAVAAADVEALLRDPHGLRDKQCFLQLFPSQVQKIEAIQGNATWTIAQHEGRWTVAEAGTALDTPRVEAWIRELAEARFSGFEDDAPVDLGRYGLSTPMAILRIWLLGQAPPQQLLLGETLKDTTSRYAKIEGRAAVVRVPEDVVQLMQQPLAALQAPAATPAPAPQ